MSCNYNPMLAYYERSPTIFDSVPFQIGDNMEDAQPIIFSTKVPTFNLYYRSGNTCNNCAINNCTYYYDKPKDKFIYDSDLMKPLNNTNNLKKIVMVPSNTIYSARRKFSPEEDTQLVKLIELNGAKNWDKIALSMPGRTGRQCRDRFNNYLKPSLTNGPWTTEEDLLLKQKVKEIGKHWNIIANFFKGRSTNNIKNRWYTYFCEDKKSSTNLSQNNQPFEYKTLNDDHGNHKFKNCEHENSQIYNNCEINGSQNSIITLPSKKEYVFQSEPSSDELETQEKNHIINITSDKNKNEKRILFPLICPPINNLFRPLNNVY